MVLLNVKFKPTPKGTDAVYVYIPGKLDVFYIRPDWADANYVTSAAITYLGREGYERKRATSGKEEIWIGCSLTDFIFEPFPAIASVGEEDLDAEANNNVIPFKTARRQHIG